MSRYAQACCKVDPAAFVKAMGWVSTQNLLARVTWKRAACTALLSLSLFRPVSFDEASLWTWRGSSC